MEFKLIPNRRGVELWINLKYHGTFSDQADMLTYIWQLATEVPEVDPPT